MAEVGPGLLVLVGAGRNEDPDEAEWLASKVYYMRIFEDDETSFVTS